MSNPTDTARLDAVMTLLDDHVPASPREIASLKRIRHMSGWLRRPLDEHDDPYHLTASAIITDGAGSVVLHKHKRLGIWLQPGGHIDDGEHAADAALREVTEETGLAAVHPGGEPTLLHVDVHEGPRGHVHLDLRYLLFAPANAVFAPAEDESADVAWFTPAAALQVADQSLALAVTALGDRFTR